MDYSDAEDLASWLPQRMHDRVTEGKPNRLFNKGYRKGLVRGREECVNQLKELKQYFLAQLDKDNIPDDAREKIMLRVSGVAHCIAQIQEKNA